MAEQHYSKVFDVNAQTWEFVDPQLEKHYKRNGLLPKVGDTMTGSTGSGPVTEVKNYAPRHYLFYYEVNDVPSR